MADTGARNVLLTLASLVVVVAGLKAAAPLLVPFMMAIFLTLLVLPLLSWLEQRIPRLLAVCLAILANLALVTGLGFLVSGSVSGFIAAAPRYKVRFDELTTSALAWLAARGFPADDMLADEIVSAGALLDLVASTLRGVASVLTNLMLVVFIMIFIVLEVPKLAPKLQVALGLPRERFARYASASVQVQRYLAVKTAVSAVTGLLVGLGVAVVGLDFPLLWGLVAFLFNYIPNLGSILAAIPPCLLSLLQLGLGPTVAVALIYLAVNMLLGNIIEPQLQGRRLGLSPLVVFLSLVFWGWVWGPVGMLISVPMTVVVRIFLENSEELRWVAVLLAARPPRTEPPAVEVEVRHEGEPVAVGEPAEPR